MIAWIALVIASLAVGLGVVALFGETWVMAHRAELLRRQIDAAWGDGWRAGREQGKRDAA